MFMQTIDGYLAVNGNSQFYAAAIPGNQVKESVSTNSQSVSVQFAWQSK
jgi:ribonuclease T2